MRLPSGWVLARREVADLVLDPHCSAGLPSLDHFAGEWTGGNTRVAVVRRILQVIGAAADMGGPKWRAKARGKSCRIK